MKDSDMKGEIRSLVAGIYNADEDSCLLEVYRDHYGIHIVNVDFDLDWYYHWIIEENGEVSFDLGSVTENEEKGMI